MLVPLCLVLFPSFRCALSLNLPLPVPDDEKGRDRLVKNISIQEQIVSSSCIPLAFMPTPFLFLSVQLLDQKFAMEKESMYQTGGCKNFFMFHLDLLSCTFDWRWELGGIG